MKSVVRIFFKTLRIILGPVLLLWERITLPRGVERSAEEQQRIDGETQGLVLYHFRTCPFCMRVRRCIRRLSLNIETRDAQHDLCSRQELLEGGGSVKVPCLRITDEQGNVSWLYESDKIRDYLEERFT